MLNGREQGLMLYWPMDEGIERYVFDASYANDLPNGRHATVGANITPSTIIPSDSKLSRYATTNENGEYIIRGIPFIGSGSTYTILPTCGIHEFSPISRNGFIGNGNLTLNSYDFTDISSFPVRGRVTYLNTNIPADSIQFKIDGDLVQTKDGMVQSDADGYYEISVPIGKHLVEAYKDGHRLTSFPLDGSQYDFKSSEIVNFVDSTLVNVTGRINGGFSDQNEPLGFNRSENRIGKATVKLSLGKESQCSFNYIVDDRGDGDYGKTDIPVESATDSIRSTAYRAALKSDNTDTYYIYITTDEKTGEFSAMLPPLKYKVESITFEGGDDYDNEPVFAQNLPIIDATNTMEKKMFADSLDTGNGMKKYLYSAKMLRQLRTTPTITVVQDGTKNGAFGEVKVPVRTLANEVDTLEAVTYSGDNYNYTFGYPIYRQNERYHFEIAVAETYKNLDTGTIYSEVPGDAVVTIANDASILTTVFAEKAIVDGKEIEAGTEYETPNILVIPNEKGIVEYEFEGGWPNLTEGHLRNISIGVQVDGRTTMWQAPNSQTEALDLVLLGSLPTGSNFMTEGPDEVAYILRRPPGSTSVASLENTTINTFGSSTTKIHDKSFGGGAYVSVAPSWECYIGTGNGFFSIMKNSHLYVVANTTNTRVDGHKDSDYVGDKQSYTFSEKVTTPNQMIYSNTNKDFRAESGDVYIGTSTNLTFSNSRIVDIFQQSDGTYKIGEKTGVSVSESFDTKFNYTQAYIQDYLIPNWKSLIKSRLIHVEGNHWDKNNPNVKKVAGEVRYYTSYNTDDPEFGHNNGDLDYWGSKYDERNGWPSYIVIDGTDSKDGVIDEVEHASNQITSWEAKIAQNEADKITAFDDEERLINNYSISGGMSYSQSNKSEYTHTVTVKDETYYNINDDLKVGLLFNNLGAYGIMVWSNKHADETVADTVTVKNNTVAWTLSDADPRTALSVDVYKSPSGWGPIFRTRGGQTVNPYEGETFTQYYSKGKKLNEGTMRVEVPQLRVIGSTEQTDVPTGGQAKFTLQIANESETNSICTYVLQAVDGSNPNGAILMIDGAPLSQGAAGRVIKLKGGEAIEKVLYVSQGDASITDYNGIELILKSEKDISTFSDKVSLRVHFVPASSHVDLSVDHTILNKAYKDDNDGITATMDNLNRQDKGLQGIRLRYRRKGVDTWSLVKQWSDLDSLIQLGYTRMPAGSRFTEKVSFPDDGLYELQAQTFGLYGTQEVTYESNIIEVTQDTHGPKILGMVSPENGLLTYTSRNNMHLRFNEVLNGNALSKSGNFRIEGGMNNVVYDESKYPDVALQLNGERISTDALFNLTNTDYAFDMWFYRQGDGNIISLGTDNNLLSLSTHDDGMLQARVGSDDDVYEANVQLPADTWMYMALNYKHKTADDPVNRITMLYVTPDDKQPNYIGKDMPAKDLEGHGKLSIGGDGMQGMVGELSIWNSDITAKQLYETRTMSRAAYTPGLVGYWLMTEGHGTQITDLARSRHMHMPAESWYINNKNRAARLSGEEGSPLKIDISTFNPAKTDNYAYEMWFRGNKSDNDGQATLFSTMNGSENRIEKADSTLNGETYEYTYKHIQANHKTAIGFDEGRLNFKLIADETVRQDNVPGTTQNHIVKSEVLLSDRNYLDGNWHHLAFNVWRGTSAVVYIDGEAVKVLPEAAVPGISSKYMFVGCEMFEANEINRFTGDVDEIRIWNAALDGKLIGERMYERMAAGYPGLAGYFPMEEIHRTAQGTVTTEFTMNNFGEEDSRIHIDSLATTPLLESINAPALKPGSTKILCRSR